MLLQFLCCSHRPDSHLLFLKQLFCYSQYHRLVRYSFCHRRQHVQGQREVIVLLTTIHCLILSEIVSKICCLLWRNIKNLTHSCIEMVRLVVGCLMTIDVIFVSLWDACGGESNVVGVLDGIEYRSTACPRQSNYFCSTYDVSIEF